jgi:hypothetical protein
MAKRKTSKRAKLRRGAKRVRKTITLPDGTRKRVTLTKLRASNRRVANGTWPHAKMRDKHSPGGPDRDFAPTLASSWRKLVDRGQVFGLKEGR